jgi:hypothetical protein
VKLLTDNFAAPNSGTIQGGTLFRSGTGGVTYPPYHCMWRRYLQPGTYLAYPAAWVNAVDASSKTISYAYMIFEIDPEMTYLPGMRP